MRARQLEVFTAVMRAGTVTAAARMLNISQPALSQILLHAEDELGFALFDRDKGRLRPTPEALELFPEAERLFAGLEGLRRKTADLRLGRAGLVRIGASAPPAMSLLPRALAAFRAQNPDVVLRSHVAPIGSLVAMLRAGMWPWRWRWMTICRPISGWNGWAKPGFAVCCPPVTPWRTRPRSRLRCWPGKP
jgi:DNA-binding transcriptional LysR family regulator